jgi:hypothetical protein
MDSPDLRADCTRCAALCCVALAFDHSAHFAFDKRAGEPCSNLDAACRCRIHARLAKSGFSGCVAYECHGAGQYVVQHLFNGRSWREAPHLLAPMMAAFAEMKAIQEARLLIAAAAKLALPLGELDRLGTYADLLHPEGGWTRSRIDNGEGRALVDEIHRYLRGLKAHFVAEADGGTLQQSVPPCFRVSPDRASAPHA